METIRRSRAMVMLAALLAAVVALTLICEEPAEARKKKRKKYKTVTVNKIVFASNRNLDPADPSTDLEIFSINPDGTGLTQLTRNGVNDIQPAFSPNGTKIAFSRRNVSQIGEIFVMNRDGSNQIELPNNTTNDSTPAWSPDGQRIAYTNGTGYEANIWVMNADGSGATRWESNPSNPESVPDFRPTFSPDGQRIAFTTMGPTLGDFEIYDMSALTPSLRSSWRNLTNNADHDYRPTYSPDGNTIIYDSEPACAGLPAGGDFDIMKINADGSGAPINLTTDDGRDNLHADFSPSGTKIVYMTLPQGNTTGICTQSPNGAPGNLFTRNADGSGTLPLTNTNNQFINQSPDWGRYMIRVRR